MRILLTWRLLVVKVLVVHNRYQQWGGENAVVEAQRRLLEEDGHQVLFYGKDSDSIRTYGVAQKLLFFPRTVFSAATYSELRALVSRERPDVAHVHNVFPLVSPSAYVALADAGVPIVQTVHNFRLLCPNGLFYTHGQVCQRCKGGNTAAAAQLRCFRDSYSLSALYACTVALHRHAGTFRRIDRFLPLVPFTATQLIESGLARADQVTVLGNFLPDPWPTVLPPSERSPYVAYMGRLAPEKGIATLVEAAAKVPHIAVKIMGSGPDENRLRKLVAALGAGNVELVGHVEGARKWELLGRALALVVPSLWYEQFPLALLEGMAAGTPAVASRLGGLDGLVEDNVTGMLFRPGDSADLADKLMVVAADHERALAMGQRARQKAEARFTARTHMEALRAIYLEVESRDCSTLGGG